MSSVAFLLGLLVVAYVGSQLMGGRSRGYRLASGAEYILLGLALGPYALGTVDRSTLVAFEPIAVVGSAWFALVVGADYGFRDHGRVAARGVVLGILISVLTLAASTAAAYFVAHRVTHLRGRELLLAACGSGLVASETTRHAVRFAVGNKFKGGKLSRLIADLADADDVVPVVGMALLFPAMQAPHSTVVLPFWAWGIGTLAIGLVLGATAAALLRSELKASDGWGVIIGAILLATGIAWRLGLAPLAATFALGASLSAFSRHGKEVRSMIARSEHAILLPTLLLAGAGVQVHRLSSAAAIVVVVFVARAAVRFLAAPVLTALSGVPPSVAPSLAVGLLTNGALSIVLGLAFVSRFPGAAGDVILSVAIGLAILGEVFGPRAFRRALVRAGELDESVVLERESRVSLAPPAPEPLP